METENEGPVAPQVEANNEDRMLIEEDNMPTINEAQNNDEIVEEIQENKEAPKTGPVQVGELDVILDGSDDPSDVLKIYYDKLFPFELLEKWLRYSNDPKSKRTDIDKRYFAKREISFTLENDIYLRNQYSSNWDELKKKVLKFRPIKIDIGAVFKASPKCTDFILEDGEDNPMQTPEEREFVIDIDMNDYNNIRTCCSEANVCQKCWKFIEEGIYVIDRALREDFGFEHIIWLFSGRRGVHAWVCDRSARQMSNEVRGALSDYLRLVSGNDKAGIKTEPFQWKLYPMIERSYERLRSKFAEVIIQDQRIFENPTKVNEILQFISDSLSVGEDALGPIIKLCRNAPNMDPEEFFNKFEQEFRRLESQVPDQNKRRKEDSLFEELVIYFMYPRIDVNVSKGMNHLLKSPFCIHPKTNKVSIPILDLENFNPDEVPTLNDMVFPTNEGRLTFDVTPLKPYVEFFENFIRGVLQQEKELQREERQEERQENEKSLEF